ncbi:hypothetical protein Tco_1170894 [Tanacetum coccineum]
MPSHISSYDGKGDPNNFLHPPKMFGSYKLRTTFVPRERNKERKDEVIRHHTGGSKKDKGAAPTESPILMVSQEAHIAKSLTEENTDCEGKEIIFPPVEKVNNAPVIIEAKIF